MQCNCNINIAYLLFFLKHKFKKKNFVSGTHLSKELGNSFKDILKDKIKIDYSFRFNPKEKNITKKENNLYLPLAVHLSEIIKSKKNIKTPSSQLQAWSQEIKKLTTINDVPIERIKRVLDCMGINSGTTFLLVLYFQAQ